MALSDREIELAIIDHLAEASRKGHTVRAANDGEFVRSLELDAPHWRTKKVLSKMVWLHTISYSRPWQTHLDNSDRPATYWLPEDRTPACVTAYRR